MVGEFKDDQLQKHGHNISTNSSQASFVALSDALHDGSGSTLGYVRLSGYTSMDSQVYANTKLTNSRSGTTTHGKQKGVKYIIKVL